MRKKKKPLGPCPDPETYIRVDTKEGPYWRKKRGLVKPAPINDALKHQLSVTRQINGATSRLRTALLPYLDRMQTGRLTIRMGNLLRERLKESGQMDYRRFRDLKFQEDYPLTELLRAGYRVDLLLPGQVRLEVPAHAGNRIRPGSGLISSYQIAGILVNGSPEGDGQIAVVSRESPWYPIGEGAEADVFTFPLPAAGTPWMLLLKVHCMEGAEPAMHARHHRMAVVAAG